MCRRRRACALAMCSASSQARACAWDLQPTRRTCRRAYGTLIPRAARSCARVSAQGALPHAVKTSECFWTLGALPACHATAPPDLPTRCQRTGAYTSRCKRWSRCELLVRLANQALRRKVDLAPQGKTWECFLLGHAGLDVLTGEADRKRILLERFQAEVCGPKVHTHTLQGCRSSLKLKPPPPQTPGFDFSGAELSGAARDASTFMR